MSSKRRENKEYVFNVFYFSFEFFVFCLILGIFCASGNANSERFMFMPTGYRSLILRGKRCRGRHWGHDGWERRKEWQSLADVDFKFGCNYFWRLYLHSPRYLTLFGSYQTYHSFVQISQQHQSWQAFYSIEIDKALKTQVVLKLESWKGIT